MLTALLQKEPGVAAEGFVGCELRIGPVLPHPLRSSRAELNLRNATPDRLGGQSTEVSSAGYLGVRAYCDFRRVALPQVLRSESLPSYFGCFSKERKLWKRCGVAGRRWFVSSVRWFWFPSTRYSVLGMKRKGRAGSPGDLLFCYPRPWFGRILLSAWRASPSRRSAYMTIATRLSSCWITSMAQPEPSILLAASKAASGDTP